jgi:hypothetical protein
MLTHQFPFLDPARITPEITARLQSLADDCARLAHDTAFVAARLRTAPVLDFYTPVITPLGLRLVGQITGHPLLPGSRHIITSTIWFADPNGQWARTLSRFYALRRPADPDALDHILTSARFVFDPHDDDGWPGEGA